MIRTIPKYLRKRAGWYYIKCPNCGLEVSIDQDQYEGKISIDCPNCKYHETHNFAANIRRNTMKPMI